MTPALALALTALFASVALVSGLLAAQGLAWTAPERRRLRTLSNPTRRRLAVAEPLVARSLESLGMWRKALPRSQKDVGRLRRELVAAGFYDLSAVAYYGAARIALPVVLGAVTWLILGNARWLVVLLAVGIGYIGPDLMLTRLRKLHQRAIENGLPDALDLLIICIEAGSSIDQAIVRATEELHLVHPGLARELRLITTEIRAGKPRLEAFQNFATRTRVDDVRSLVSMLTQTDRFGTSVAQALRVHAETSRTKRRQRAEERAAKVGVKLVFPLVLCIFPGLYVVCVGSAFLAIFRGLTVLR
jgi:tight adherence protein C